MAFIRQNRRKSRSAATHRFHSQYPLLTAPHTPACTRRPIPSLRSTCRLDRNSLAGRHICFHPTRPLLHLRSCRVVAVVLQQSVLSLTPFLFPHLALNCLPQRLVLLLSMRLSVATTERAAVRTHLQLLFRANDVPTLRTVEQHRMHRAKAVTLRNRFLSPPSSTPTNHTRLGGTRVSSIVFLLL